MESRQKTGSLLWVQISSLCFELVANAGMIKDPSSWWMLGQIFARLEILDRLCAIDYVSSGFLLERKKMSLNY
ncbi:hypothetical protein H5410_055256 [Solanum commersonii]|uniref:Uncharacterized protein n=1 Tax=Solanum commersonii TaxID=4109 RepID=A0A9J5WHQ9_SOLCO|nr:hypothetical protein H5410_055256 [Solanum commersonii]